MTAIRYRDIQAMVLEINLSNKEPRATYAENTHNQYKSHTNQTF